MELDNEIFQLATLGGIVLILLILLMVMSIQSRISRRLKELHSGGGQLPALEASLPEPEPVPAAEPVPTQALAPVVYAEPAPLAVAPVAAQPAAFTPEPYAAPAPQAVAPAAAPEPQEQPFERDGRWWFRRGNELLIYDEQSAQWVPAPAEATGGIAPGVMAPPTTEQAGDSGFWKCPSCGAVNGSTATSCRMCFTARP